MVVGLYSAVSDVDLAISRCKKLESLLERHGATGRGLHEKTSSLTARLPAETIRQLRFIATVRNRILHEADYERIDDRPGFLRACDEAEQAIHDALGDGRPGKRSTVRRIAAGLLIAIIVAAVVVVLQRMGI